MSARSKCSISPSSRRFSPMKHDDIINWKHFQCYWPFERGIHRSPVNSPHKGQRRGALMFYLICAWTNGWINNRDAGDLRRHRAHYDVTVMNCNIQYTDSFRFNKNISITNAGPIMLPTQKFQTHFSPTCANRLIRYQSKHRSQHYMLMCGV